MPSTLFRDVWESIANRGLDLLRKRGPGGAVSLGSLCRELLSEGGEASGTTLAREVAGCYRRLAPCEREKFFLNLLKADFLPNPQSVLAAVEKYRVSPDSETLAELFAVVEPPRQELFRRINLAPGGTQAVVRMREDLLNFLPVRPELKPLDADLRHVLSSWFNRGFLRLERINWRTPALVLEKIIAHEAVHEIRGWDDLRRRLARDRRCFAFFHPALPDEPLIFVEVALTRGLPSCIQTLLACGSEPLDPRQADTAVFYSISNCLGGRRGIPFGSFLIKQVIAELQAEKLRLGLFATLSPVPGFRTWLKSLSADRREVLVADDDLATLSAVEAADWQENLDVWERARPLLLRVCAHYLLYERKRDRALDPVAAFDLANGAAVEQINWLADKSEKGLTQSFGLMVNYAYRPRQIEGNHEGYVKRGRIAGSAKIGAMLRQPSPVRTARPEGDNESRRRGKETSLQTGRAGLYRGHPDAQMGIPVCVIGR